MDEGSDGFPVSAGVLFSLGLGGFFDGIVFHQLLQWHHMLTSAGYPPDSIENLKVNTFLATCLAERRPVENRPFYVPS